VCGDLFGLDDARVRVAVSAVFLIVGIYDLLIVTGARNSHAVFFIFENAEVDDADLSCAAFGGLSQIAVNALFAVVCVYPFKACRVVVVLPEFLLFFL